MNYTLIVEYWKGNENTPDEIKEMIKGDLALMSICNLRYVYICQIMHKNGHDIDGKISSSCYSDETIQNIIDFWKPINKNNGNMKLKKHMNAITNFLSQNRKIESIPVEDFFFLHDMKKFLLQKQHSSPPEIPDDLKK
jgi:hypothetical protein